MILAIIVIISGSGYIIYERLNTHFASSVKETHPTPIPIPVEKEDKPTALSTQARQFLAENTPPKAPKEKKEKTLKLSVIETKKDSAKIKKTQKKIKAIKTVFKYKNLKAKSVFVTGSFTKWKNIEMKKKKGLWQANVWILPGTYLFHYVVDGQKVLDSSKPTASIGESIIDVGN